MRRKVTVSVQVNHPVLGLSRPDGEHPHRCSKCGVEIEEGSVPWMMWDSTGNVMWVYCDDCKGPIAAAVIP